MEYSFIVLTAESRMNAAVDALTQLVRTDARGEVIAVAADPAAPGAAANEAARQARGSVLLFVRDAVPHALNFIAPVLDAFATSNAGVAGGVLLSPAGEIEETGLIFHAARLSFRGFSMHRQVRAVPAGDAAASAEFCDAVSLRCLATPRALFEELAGFDEALGETYAAVDYALRARESGRNSVVVPAMVVVRTAPVLAPLFPPSDDGRMFAARWRGRAFPLENAWAERDGYVVREDFTPAGLGLVLVPLFPATVVVHGPAPADPDAFAAALRGSRLQPAEVIWTGRDAEADGMAAARAVTERRGEGYVVFVRGDAQLEADWLNHLIAAVESGVDNVAAERSDGTTIVAPRQIPQHLRLREDLGLSEAVNDWIARAEAHGRCVRRERGPAAAAPVAIAAGTPGLTSIVTLSWNAPEYTEVAIASIRAHTHIPHEIIVVDNGSRPETVRRIAALPGVRVIFNPVNTGFAFGSNQGLAAARGSHVVILNNDVIVTAGWLEALLDVQRRRPTIGVSSPRSNSVVGSQQLEDAVYDSIPEMHAYAARRSREHRAAFDLVPRASGFCLCIDRRVIEEVGGFDPRFGLGNFEDDDLCIRIRAAGYEIAVCHDSFIHHFGSASFNANGLSYAAIMQTNSAAFLKRWDLAANAAGSWDALPAIRRGFVRERDYVPLPAPEPAGADFVIGSWT